MTIPIDVSSGDVEGIYAFDDIEDEASKTTSI